MAKIVPLLLRKAMKSNSKFSVNSALNTKKSKKDWRKSRFSEKGARDVVHW